MIVSLTELVGDIFYKYFQKGIDIRRTVWYDNNQKGGKQMAGKKKRKKIKKRLQRFAWDVTVGATAGIITYLLSKLIG